MRQVGTKFKGSSKVESSTADLDLVDEGDIYYKFSFMPEEDCLVSINGSEPILIRPGLGFSMNQADAYINSFKILTNGVNYTWIGGLK